MPTSPLKLPSAGRRLRQPAHAGPLPVRTGFPTSLADLVVNNHVRRTNPRRRHRPGVVHPSPAPPVAAEPSPPDQEPRREVVLTVQNAAAVVRRKGAVGFSIRPDILAVCGPVALALLVIWSKWLVAAATLASVALFGIESASSRWPRLETAELQVSSGRGRVSPIREEAESSEAGTPISSLAGDTADGLWGFEVSSLWAADTAGGLAGSANDPITPKRKEKRRSLRKLIAQRLRNGKRSSKDRDADTCSLHSGESKHTEHAGEAGINAVVPVKTEPASLPPDTTPPDAVTDERREKWGAFPSAVFLLITLVGLVAGKFPAVALTVLSAVFFSSADRAPAR